MATFEARLARIESQLVPEIQTNMRDPKLVELTRQMLGQDYPLEHSPCGISGKEFLDMALRDVWARGTSLALPIIADVAPESGMEGRQYGYV